jgi:hypothetical protein
MTLSQFHSKYASYEDFIEVIREQYEEAALIERKCLDGDKLVGVFTDLGVYLPTEDLA